MLRITFDTTTVSGHDVLKLDGEIAGRWVEELRRTCSEILRDRATPLLIDLKGVTFIDLDGIALFRELWGGVSVTNYSLFAAEQLRELLLASHRMK
jgi:anti-anti-sigma factor